MSYLTPGQEFRPGAHEALAIQLHPLLDRVHLEMDHGCEMIRKRLQTALLMKHALSTIHVDSHLGRGVGLQGQEHHVTYIVLNPCAMCGMPDVRTAAVVICVKKVKLVTVDFVYCEHEGRRETKVFVFSVVSQNTWLKTNPCGAFLKYIPNGKNTINDCATHAMTSLVQNKSLMKAYLALEETASRSPGRGCCARTRSRFVLALNESGQPFPRL